MMPRMNGRQLHLVILSIRNDSCPQRHDNGTESRLLAGLCACLSADVAPERHFSLLLAWNRSSAGSGSWPRLRGGAIPVFTIA